jgi:aminomethyltransferase
VLEADLGWILKLEKGDFLGRDVLALQKAQGVDPPPRRLRDRRARHRAARLQGDVERKEVGIVTSGTFAPFLKKNIGLVYLPRALAQSGSRFSIDIRGRLEPAVVVPTPFYRRTR